jgi:hypothetical protein
MPRPKAPASLVVDRIPLAAPDCKHLALLLGYEELPPQCRDELGEVLACHLQAARAERELADKPKTTPGNVVAAIVKACNAVEDLIALDSGVDADTRRDLRASAKAFLEAAQIRIGELGAMPRVYPHLEPLRQTCAILRLIFEKHALLNSRTSSNLRRFAFRALQAADIQTPSIDESNLTRLDEYLHAEPHPLD